VISVSVYTTEPLSSIALELLFRQCEQIALLPVVSDLSNLLQQVSSQKPDVLLLTVNSHFDRNLWTALRRQSDDTKIILWLHEITPELAYQAIECGIRGILRKNLPPEMIVKCVQKVHAGELWFDQTLTQTFLSGRSITVSPREGELIKLVAQGLKNREIAKAMSITEGTVKVYLSRLFEKLGVRDRVELVLVGLRNLQGTVEQGAPALSDRRHSDATFKSRASAARKKNRSQSTRFFVAGPSIQ
jgi:two-component system nitrate/nitrite response regulator NarL